MNTQAKRLKRIIIWTLVAIPVLGIPGCSFWVPGRIAEAVVAHSIAVGETRKNVSTLLAVTGTAATAEAPNVITAQFFQVAMLCVGAGDEYRIEFDASDRVK